MVPRAIADSDDEQDSDDDNFNATHGNDSGGKVGADTPLDALAEPSTGSTESLRRQLYSAQRRFWTDSASGEMADAGPQAAVTPAAQAGSKRRHTAALTSEASPTPSSGVKRAKTSKASPPATKAALQAATHGSFTRTSQTMMFSEHSATNSSALLPRDSLQEDFLNHEPSVMFPESGSTVADGSSAQKEMVDALNENNRPLLSTSVVNTLNPDGLEISSLPWSAFESNGRPGSSGGQAEPVAETANGEESVERAAVLQKVSDDAIHVSTSVGRSSKHAQSPVVEIRQPERGTPVSRRASLTGSPTTSNRHKRKAEDEQHSSDVLHSDDRAIGLPKELYQPRPTKRRATAVLEQPVDLSVRPGKAAKAKRTKTTDATPSRRDDEASITTRTVCALAAESSVKTTGGSQTVTQEHAAIATKSNPVDGTPNGDKAAGQSQGNIAEASTQHEDRNAEPALTAEDAATASTPAPPPPKKKSSAKAKRAQTTIFEDHVEFVGSQRSPNLSQQQASRKAALKAGKHETGKRKRKAVVSDDEDEDSFVKDAEEKEETEPPPQKRGRGRPPKATAKPPQKSAEKVLENSDSDGETQVEVKEVSRKTSKDPPSMNTTETTSKDAEKPIVRPSSPQPLPKEPIEPPIGNGGEASYTADPISTPERMPTATEIPTPSPEKENTDLQQQASKGSPTSHSPIKGSSKVPLRVGLSKRQRIPSLLRVMRPLKK